MVSADRGKVVLSITMRPIPLLLSLSLSVVLAPLGIAAEPPVNFETQVKPILQDRCVECHNSENLLGNFNMENRASVVQKRKEGPVIVPKAPEKSMLFLTLNLPATDKKAMPATAHRLSKTDVDIIRRWIAEGAEWPEGKAGRIVPRKKAKG